MVRFVTFVHKDLFFDKYFHSSKGEIHLKILQTIGTTHFDEVVNEVKAGIFSNILGAHMVLEHQSDL